MSSGLCMGVQTRSSKKRKAEEVTGGLQVGRQPLTKRRCIQTIDLKRFLTDHVEEKHPLKSPAKASMDKSLTLFRRSKATKIFLRKEHSAAAQALVIFLRFGSLSSDERQWLTPGEVQLRTGIAMATQHSIVKRWKANGYMVNKVKRPGRPPRLTHEQVSWIISTETLQYMSNMSLR